MGTILAIFLVISLNMAPKDAQSLTINSYVVEGVGISADPTAFLITREAASTWILHSAQGAPWFQVSVTGPVITLTDLGSGGSDEVDLGAALGLAADPWWAADAVEPPGFTPIVLAHRPDGFNASLDGLRAAEVRW